MVTQHETKPTKTPEPAVANPDAKGQAVIPGTDPVAGTKSKTKKPRLDLAPIMADAMSTLPEGCEIEVSNIAGGGKRIDLVRPDGMIVRLKSDAKGLTDCAAILEGIAIGRRIQ